MTIKKFKVIVVKTTELELVVGADNEEDAVDLACGADEDLFREIPDSDDWNIKIVKQINETESKK